MNSVTKSITWALGALEKRAQSGGRTPPVLWDFIILYIYSKGVMS